MKIDEINYHELTPIPRSEVQNVLNRLDQRHAAVLILRNGLVDARCFSYEDIAVITNETIDALQEIEERVAQEVGEPFLFRLKHRGVA